MPERIKLLGELPKKCYVAVSGGADSMAILDFINDGKRDVQVLHFNHGTEHGKEAEEFVRNYCLEKNIIAHFGHIDDYSSRYGNIVNKESIWRECRYQFFSKKDDRVIVLGHQLDDQLESHIYSTIRNGHSNLIPYIRQSYSAILIRPFLLTKRKTLEEWCDKRNVPFINDPSNYDNKYARSFIRQEMIDKALYINPGLYKLISKLVIRNFKDSSFDIEYYLGKFKEKGEK